MSNMVTTGQEMVRENFIDMNHHIGHEIEQQTDGAGFQESRSFLRVIIKELFIHVDCMCLAESIN